MKQLFLCIISLFAISCSPSREKSVSPLLTPEVKKQVDELYERMTVEERVAQLCDYEQWKIIVREMSGENSLWCGACLSVCMCARFRAGGVAGFCQGFSVLFVK